MPIYEYKRPDGTTFEIIQKFSDDPLTKDPETGVPVERVYTAPAIHFKGSGFHNTDYGSKRRPKAGTDSDSGSSSGSSSSGESNASDSGSKSSSTDSSTSSPANTSGPAKSSSDSSSSGSAK
ncbi:MAG: zinc ribbon domain-containing protein [Solirubrobacterales bacterium]